MPKWSEYKAISKERGSLALELYIVETTPKVAPDEMKKILPAHLAYQAEMEKAGKLFLAGPVSDATGEEMQGTGMIVYRAASLEEAKSIADNDPMHKEGARSYNLRRWLINEGSMNLSVGLSTKTIKFDQNKRINKSITGLKILAKIYQLAAKSLSQLPAPFAQQLQDYTR